MDERAVASLAGLATRETPEERQARELANIEARERLQQRYSERLVAAAAGGAGARQTPDQMAAREEVRGAATNMRGAERDFRRVLGRRPVITKFQDRTTFQPDTAAFTSALDAWRADSTDAAAVRDDAREEVAEAEKVRNQLFPTFGRTAAAAADQGTPAAPPPPLGSSINGVPTLSLPRDQRVANAEREYDALIGAGIDPSVAARSIAAKWGIRVIDQP
jgi:hypothetical protein